jgi:pyruvate/2-oxoglutarate dehydrogenase complex dihydrolipoamide acyltransferase (E2) component
MAPPRKKISTAPPEERVEAEIVSDDFEQQPNDEVVAAGEHIDHDALEEQGLVMPAPSVQNNPYVSEEEQGMEMRPTVLGPPAYGSPDPVTSVGRLVSLTSHPLSAEILPEGHPAALSEDFGEGYDGTLKGDATITSAPVAAQTTAEPTDEEGEGEGEYNATAGAVELAEAEGVDLGEVEASDPSGRITKADVEAYLSDQS